MSSPLREVNIMRQSTRIVRGMLSTRRIHIYTLRNWRLHETAERDNPEAQMTQTHTDELTEVAVYEMPEVASKLKCSRNHAYVMAREGVIPSIRLGRRVIVPRKAFDEWLRRAGRGDDPR